MQWQPVNVVITLRGCEKIEPGGQCVRKPVLGFSHTPHAQICVTLFVLRHCGRQRNIGERSNQNAAEPHFNQEVPLVRFFHSLFA